MNNVIDLVEVFKAFKDEAEKQQFLESQFNVMLNLQQKIKNLEEENLHLKELLVANAPHLNLPLPILITPEEHLIDAQINILEQRGRLNELTLEETKKLDLLLKNKKIIKDGKPVIEIPKPSKGKLSMKELAVIASTPAAKEVKSE
jgi:hypothetical protein